MMGSERVKGERRRGRDTRATESSVVVRGEEEGRREMN